MKPTRLMIWAGAAVLAVGVTTAAVAVANASGGSDEVLSQDDVSRELAAETPGPPAPPSEAPPSEAPTAMALTPGDETEPVALHSRAGQVVANCHGLSLHLAERSGVRALAYLESWSPNPGYRVDDVERGPRATVSVEFESDSYEDVEVTVVCEAGEPRLTEDVEPDDNGRDDDDDDHDDDDDDDHDDDHDDDD